jgi:ubiquinone/menaquinone biosynthesis C-methylase UbiE
MSLYQRWIVPRLIELSMRQSQLQEYRSGLVPDARGRVLEVGVGSGMNLPFYGTEVREVVGVDPSTELLEMARTRAGEAGVPVTLTRASATSMPLEDASFDTIVMTWTLCSIPDPAVALREMRRVLRPGGTLLFIEHGLSPDADVARWQHRLTPVWRRFTGGCHLDRKVDDLICAAGFDLPELKNEYATGPRPMTYMYEGHAVRST